MGVPLARYEIRADDKTAQGIKSARDGLKHIGVGIAAVGAAAVAAGAGMAALWAKTAPGIDNLAKTSRNIGTTTEALAGLRLAAEYGGVGAAAMDKALLKFNRSLGDAAVGTGYAKRELEALGLKLDDVRKMNSDEAIATIAERMNGLTDQTEKARIASNLFGRDGARMMTLFEMGADGIRKAVEEAKAFGLALSAADAAKVEEANDAITRVKGVMQGAANEFTVEMAPAVKAMADTLVEHADDVKRVVDGLVVIGKVGANAILLPTEMVLTGLEEMRLGAVKIVDWINEALGHGRDAVEQQIVGWETLADGTQVAVTRLSAVGAAARDAGTQAGAGLRSAITLVRELQGALNAPPEPPKPVKPPPVKPGDDTVGAPVVNVKAADIYGPDFAAYQEHLAAKQAALEESFRTEREALALKREEDLTANQEAWEKGLVDEETYYAQRSAIEGRFADRSRAISEQIKRRDSEERASKARMVSGSLDSLAQLAAGMAEHNKAAFAVMKAARIADAVINTYAGANLALATYPPPWGAIAAAGVIAAGLANVATITSTGFGGGGGGGGGGSAGASPPSLGSSSGPAELPAAPVQEEKQKPPAIITVNLGDSQWITKDQVRDMMDQINEQHDDGYKLNFS